MAKGAHSKAEAVYGELKESILSGALEPGRLIDKADLCDRLGVSRFPVSAAVSRLAYDRLVDVAPQHGSFVVPDLAQGCARKRSSSAKRAGMPKLRPKPRVRMTREDKDALVVNLREAAAAVEADDRATFYAIDVAFHQVLTARLGMARASEILDGFARSSRTGATASDVAARALARGAQRT